MDGMDALYTTFLDLCPAAPALPAPWDFLAADELQRCGVNDARLIVATLASAFGADKLVAAGIAYRDPQRPGQLRLARALHSPGRIWPLRSASGVSRGLLTREGVLPHRHFSLAAVSHTDPNDMSGVVFGCFSSADVAILQALGFRTTLVRSLRQVRPRRLRLLDRLYKMEDGRRPALLLTGWSIARCEPRPPRQLAATRRCLVEARQNLGFDLGGVLVWRPSEQFIDKLRLRLHYRTRRGLRNLLEDSLGDVEDIAGVPAADPRDDDLVHVAGKLRERYRSGDDPEDFAELERRHDDLVQQQLIDPVKAQALQREDKHLANLEMLLGNNYQQLHRLGPKLQGLMAGGQLSDELLFKRYDRLMQRMCGLMTTTIRYSRS